MTITLLTGDCRDVLPTLAANSVHMVCTSPPYWNLRDYGTAQWEGGDAACDHALAFNDRDPVPPICRQCRKCGRLCRTRWLTPSSVRAECDQCCVSTDHTDVLTSGTWQKVSNDPRGNWAKATARLVNLCPCGARRIDRQLGLEATPDEYLAAMVGVFREVRRVLRPDGTCWVNMGDSYDSGTSSARKATQTAEHGYWQSDDISRRVTSPTTKPKDLLLMPARLALALQADGWWVRSDIIWAKPNPMPESCTDRPTSAHEHVFLLTKRARYFYDADAVRESASENTHAGYASNGAKTLANAEAFGVRPSAFDGYRPSIRNLRNVWSIATHAFPQAHFATYPPELVERCIRAGTSERGCCAACGAPWVRVTERSFDHDAAAVIAERRNAKYAAERRDPRFHQLSGIENARLRSSVERGWSPSCAHDAECVPATVLDPFLGSGTTALVADRLQRHCIGIDLSTTYADLARNRLEADCPLFTSWAPAEPPEDERMRDLFAEAAE